MSDNTVQASTTTTTDVTAGKVVVKTTTVSPLTQLGYWTAGIVGSFISAAAGAISSGLGAPLIAPESFNLGTGLHNLMKLMLITALIPGLASLAKYLNLHPIPQGWDGSERRLP